MGIADWFRSLRAEDDAEAIHRFEARSELPDGDHFLAGEDPVDETLDAESVSNELRDTLPREPGIF